MAVAEACIIKSFRRGYISCNPYYSKLCRLVPAQDKSYKRDSSIRSSGISIALSLFALQQFYLCETAIKCPWLYEILYDPYFSVSSERCRPYRKGYFPVSKRHKKSPHPLPCGREWGARAFYTLLLTVAHQLFQLIEEALDVRELLIDRGKADIGHLVEFFSVPAWSAHRCAHSSPRGRRCSSGSARCC